MSLLFCFRTKEQKVWEGEACIMMLFRNNSQHSFWSHEYIDVASIEEKTFSRFIYIVCFSFSWMEMCTTAYIQGNKLVVSPCITRSNKSFSVHSLILNVTFPRFKRMCCCILKFWEKPEMVIWEFKTFFSPFWWWLLFATNVWGNVLSAKVPQNNEIWIKIASLKNFHWFSLLFWSF